MARYIAVRIVWIFVMVATILSMQFVLLKIAPAYPPTTKEARGIYFNKQVEDGYMTLRLIEDPQEIEETKKLIAEGNAGKNSFYEVKDDLIRAYEPISVGRQYLSWIKNVVLRWDWGLSTKVDPGRSTMTILAERIPTTMTLNLIALVFYIPIGISLGIISALKKNKPIDNFIQIAVMILISVPSFVVLILFIMLFGYKLDWVPTIFPAKDADMWIRIKGVFIPVIAMTTSSVAGLTRYTRAELTEVLTSEFLLLARTKGLTRKQAVIRHALRNSMVPIVPSIIFSFVGILSGSVIMEQIYSIPGTGSIYIQALTKNAYDYNVLLTSGAFYTTIGLFAVLIVDLTYGLVDPRIRMGGRK